MFLEMSDTVTALPTVFVTATYRASTLTSAAFKDSDIRQAVALEQAKAKSVQEVMDNPAKKKKLFIF